MLHRVPLAADPSRCSRRSPPLAERKLFADEVVVLEDVQWSDVATIDLLAVLGQRRERAQLLVIATSRRSEAQTVAHPLNRVMRTLTARGGAIAMPIERIAAGDIEQLVAARFTPHAFPDGFVDVVDRITAGTPLFLGSMLDELVGRGTIAQRDGCWQLTVPISDVAAHRPDSVKQLIDIQLDRLAATEQRVLEAASAIGAEFSTALVAAALEQSVEQIDEVCDGLARRGLFLRQAGVDDWPDGSQHSRYRVVHGLVQEVCLERGGRTRLQRWHRLIAERLEAGYAERVAEVSTMLATQYDKGQVVARAVLPRGDRARAGGRRAVARAPRGPAARGHGREHPRAGIGDRVRRRRRGADHRWLHHAGPGRGEPAPGGPRDVRRDRSQAQST